LVTVIYKYFNSPTFSLIFSKQFRAFIVVHYMYLSCFWLVTPCRSWLYCKHFGDPYKSPYWRQSDYTVAPSCIGSTVESVGIDGDPRVFRIHS